MVNPAGADRGNEWVSIINLSGEPVDLSGWTLCDGKRNPLELGDVLADDTRVLAPGAAVVVKPITPLQLANTGGVISQYQDPENGEEKGKRVDRVRYAKDDARKDGTPPAFLAW